MRGRTGIGTLLPGVLSMEEKLVLKNRLKEVRAEKKLSQAELADEVDVTRQTIISLENGRYNASLLLAHRISKYFGLTIEEVFLFEEDEP